MGNLKSLSSLYSTLFPLTDPKTRPTKTGQGTVPDWDQRPQGDFPIRVQDAVPRGFHADKHLLRIQQLFASTLFPTSMCISSTRALVQFQLSAYFFAFVGTKGASTDGRTS